MHFHSPHDAIEKGIGLVTEDRKRIGLILGQSIIQNMMISSLETVANLLGVINEAKERNLGRVHKIMLRVRDCGLSSTARGVEHESFVLPYGQAI